MVYYPYSYSISINTQCIAGENLMVWWYNPHNGMAYFNGGFPNKGIFSLLWDKRLRKGMGGPDWVLVIDDAAKNYSDPGGK